MGICGRLLSLYRREESPVDKRGKVCLANGELHSIKYSPRLRVRVCILSFTFTEFRPGFAYLATYIVAFCAGSKVTHQ